jgi:hypothetical protein
MRLDSNNNIMNNGKVPTSSPSIYNGDAIKPQKDYQTVRINRPIKTRRRSPLKIIMIIFLVSITIVFYIWNKICVDHLVIEVNDLTNHYENLVNTNEFLRAEVNRKASLERVEQLITIHKLGLVYPKEQPISFQIDESKLEAIYKR